jgi:hypothetical protein
MINLNYSGQLINFQQLMLMSLERLFLCDSEINRESILHTEGVADHHVQEVAIGQTLPV